MRRILTQGGIYVVDLDGIGCEQSGLRPCIVVSNQVACAYSPTVTIVPITSKDKKYMPTHYILNSNRYNYFNENENTVLCEQIRTVDKCRFRQFLGKLRHDDFNGVLEKINRNFHT